MAWTKKRTSKDTAPEPFSATEVATIKAAQASFQFFLHEVFPKSFPIKFRMADMQKHEFQLGEIHYMWAKMVEDHDRVCILAPRAHLKSTVLNYGFSFWKLFRANQDVDGVVISFKDNLAQKHTIKLKEAIQNNPYTRFWTDNKPMAESIVDYNISFNDGLEWRGRVDPYGVMSVVRGLHPTFLIVDDMLPDVSNALDPVVIKRIDAIFRQSLESLPAEGNSLVVIGTPQSYEDTLYSLHDNNQYVWGRFPAIYEEGPLIGTPLWPEMFDLPRLKRTRERVKELAWQVEFMLKPLMSVNSFLPQAVVEDNCDPLIRCCSLLVPFNAAGTVGMYGGMDVGKKVHPSHVSVGALMPNGDIIQVYQEFLDGMNYAEQAKHIKKIIAHFNIKRFYYDNTRAEMDDRNMSRRALGMTFTRKSKGNLALGMEHRFYADPQEPGIVLIADDRQTKQIVAVDNMLNAVESESGHGDSFWSVALMIKAAEHGPVILILGNAQDTFGLNSAGRRALPEAMRGGR